MKKIKLVLTVFITLLILPIMVSAASGTIKVTGTSTVVEGNKVTLTVTLSSSTNIGSWQMQLNYDKNYLQLTSTTAESNGISMSNSSSGTKSQKYTYTFKTKKTGSTTVSVGSYLVYAYDDMSEMSISSTGKTIKIITQAELEASYSKDNNLGNLSVEGFEITPAFSKDTLDYSVTVPEGTTSVNVIATPNDRKASVTGSGTVEVTEGSNEIKIVVRAENGSEKTYNLVVNVIDENPINVTYENENYTVIKIRSNYTCPELFEESEIVINEFNIPACVNGKINYTLVGLKKEDGTIENFVYNNGKYTKYQEVVGTSIKIVALDYDGEIDGLKEYKENINGEEYQVFKFSKSSKFYVIYGINVETGEKDFYVFDSKTKTFSLYDTEYIDYLKEQNKIYLYVVIAFGIGLFLSLICTISLINSKNKLKKNIINNKEKNTDVKENNEKEDKNNIEEAIEETDIFNILDEKKRTKKNKK